MVLAGFQKTAARGSVARNPEPLKTNLMSPGASGSEALVLLSARSSQPGGTCAVRLMIPTDPISIKNRIRFMSAAQREERIGACHPPRRNEACRKRGQENHDQR